MIQVYINENTNYSQNGDMALMPTVCTIDAKLNGTWSVKLVHPIDKEGRWKYITDEAVIRVPSFNGSQLFRVYERKKSDKGVEAKLLPIFYDAAKDVFIQDKRPTYMTGQQALTELMAGTIYSGESDIETQATAYYIRKNLLECISGKDDNAFIKRWGGEAIYDNFKIILNARAGADNGVTVRYGLNLQTNGFEEIVNLSGVLTRVYPQGYNGVTSSEPVDSPLINKYPTVRCGVREYKNIRMSSDVTGGNTEGLTICYTQAELDTALRAAVEKDFEDGLDKPAVTIKAKMILLQNTEEYKEYQNLQNVSLGDTVHVYHTRLGIMSQLRVIELIYDGVTDEISEVTLGDALYSYFDQTARTLNAMNGSIVDISGAARYASEEAREAQRTADYTRAFFWADDEGVHVSTVDGDASQGKNVLVDADGLAIRNGSVDLATFGDSLIELGKGNENAKISLVDDKATMTYDAGEDTFWISGLDVAEDGPRVIGVKMPIDATRQAAGHKSPRLVLDTNYNTEQDSRVYLNADHFQMNALKESGGRTVGYIDLNSGIIEMDIAQYLFVYSRAQSKVLMTMYANDSTGLPAYNNHADQVDFPDASSFKVHGIPIYPYKTNTTITGVRLVRQGNIVVMVMNRSQAMTANTQFSIGTIPTGYRPQTATVIVAQYASASTPVGSARVVANTNGSLVGQESSQTGTYVLYATACWITDDSIS